MRVFRSTQGVRPDAPTLVGADTFRKIREGGMR
jgi:hypothetical protein